MAGGSKGWTAGVREVPFLKRRITVKLILLDSRRVSPLLPGIVLAALVAACGGSGGGPSAPTAVIQKTSTASGDGQTRGVTTALANPLRVGGTVKGAPRVGTSVRGASPAAGAAIRT